MKFLPEFKNYLFSQKNPSSKITVKNYISDIFRFINWLISQKLATESDFDPSLVSAQIVELFKTSMSGKLSPASMERNLSSLRKFFNFLKLEGYIENSPFELSINKTSEIDNDPYRLKEFKNYLYVYNASRVTIKNYLMDVRGFLKWLEIVSIPNNVWDAKGLPRLQASDKAGKDILGKIDTNLIEEYKRRLTYAPRTINRKLSSLRKYLKWAEEEGILNKGVTQGQGAWQRADFRPVFPEGKEARKSSTDGRMVQAAGPRYSHLPPIRLFQKTALGLSLLPDFLVINPLASLIRKTEFLSWKLRGKPVFTGARQNKIKVKNLSKEAFAPLAISLTNIPLHRRLLFHVAHTRPNWYRRYHSYPISHYLHVAILVVFTTAVGFGVYQSFIQKPQVSVLGTNLQSPPNPRIFSFQGKLTDSSNNPITSTTNLRFGIYTSPTGTGSGMLWQEVDTVTPDSDGIFSILLGKVSTMQQDMFANHAGLWLGVTVGQTAELTPRQQLATVAYAENSETLQGLPPITQTGAATSNVVLALDSSGNLTIGGSATPTFQATGGQFTLSGNTLALTTTTGTNGDIIATPSGLGKIDLQKPIQNTSNNNNISSALGAVEVDDMLAVLATSSGQSAFTINQNGTGPLISASTSGTAKFTVDNSGSTTIAGGNFSQTGTGSFSTGTGAISLNGNTTIASGNNFTVTSGNTSLTSSAATSDALSLTDTSLTSGTGFNQTYTLNAGNGQTSIGQSINLTDSTTGGGGYTGLAVTISGSGVGSGNKYLLDLNPGNVNREIIVDSTGSLRPTQSVATNTTTIGSPSFYFKNGYFDQITANTIAGAISSGSTSSTSWTLGNTQTGDVNEALIFQRNSGSGNATLQWNAGTGDLRFLTVNYPFNATYTVNDTSISQAADLFSGTLTNNTTAGTQNLLSLLNTGTGTTENGIYLNNTGTGTTAIQIAGTWTTGLLTNNLPINAGTGTITSGAVNGLTLTSAADGFTIAGGTISRTLTLTGANITIGSTIEPTATGALTVQSNGAQGLTLDTGGAATLSVGTANTNAISIGKTGVTTTNNGALTSTQTLTASNGLTQTTGALSLTATSGSLSLSGLSASSISTGVNNLTITSNNFNTTSTGINGTVIGATTPSTGTFTNLTVQNSGAQDLFQTDTTGMNITINGANTGQNGAWTTDSNNTPTQIWGAGIAPYNGYVYSVGGSSSLTAVYYSKLNVNGSLNAWATNSNSLPVSRTDAPAVAADGYIYQIGGCTADGCSGVSAQNTVYYAKFNADGSIGSWTSSSSTLPVGLANSNARIVNGYLYVIGGWIGNGGGAKNGVYYVKLNSDGSLGSWQTNANSLPLALHNAASAVANGYIYIFGGCNGNWGSSCNAGTSSAVYYAKLNSDGSIGTWTTNTNALPQPLNSLSATTLNGYVYILSGVNGTNQSTVYYAKLNSDGSIGTWTTSSNPLPAADEEDQESGFAVNGYIYLPTIGGRNLYYASTSRTQIAGSLDLVGISGQTLADQGSGGSITAGDITAVGELNVTNQANFIRNVSIGNNLSVAGGATITGTANINATGTSATNIGNSTGALTLASGGTSSWTNTSGNLTLSTATSGTLALTSAGALNLTSGDVSTYVLPANTANAFRFTDGTNAYETINTQTTTSGVSAFTWIPGTAPTIASAASAQYIGGTFTPGTINLTGTTNVTGTGTSSNLGLLVNQLSLNGNNTNTISESSNFLINGPAKSTSSTGTQTITNSYGLNILAGAALNGTGGAVTNGYGLSVNAPTGAANNYAAIFQGGNVGIGVSSPSTSLEASGVITTDTNFNVNSSSANPFEIQGTEVISRPGSSSTLALANAGNGYWRNLAFYTGNGVSSNERMRIDTTGNVGINQTNPSNAQLEVDNHLASQVAMLVKGYTSQSSDLLELQNSLGTVLAKVDQLGNITGNTLTSTVATGTAPLTVTSTTEVANLNAAAAQEPLPNLVTNSDYSRRNKWMTFMYENFADTSGWSATCSPSVASNILTIATSNCWMTAGLSTWKDVRMSAQVQNNPAGGYYAVAKYADSNDYVTADIYNGNFEIRKVIGGTLTYVATVAQSLTSSNWYWLELEAQGTTYIAKLYSSGASAGVKSSATLLQTLSGTISDSAVASGQIALQSNQANSQWGGLSSFPGGVYVEGWGPEGIEDSSLAGGTSGLWSGKGGAAIGFDETADAGPLGKQWALEMYIPATDRQVDFFYNGPSGSMAPSTSYTGSIYEKGTGSVRLITYGVDANNANSDGGVTPINGTADGSWTKKTGTWTTATTTRRWIYRITANPSSNSTGTVWIDLPQIEQGSVATPWRNAPADDDPIVWNLQKNVNVNTDITSTSAYVAVDERDLGINLFLPWDGNLTISPQVLAAQTTPSFAGYILPFIDGNSIGAPFTQYVNGNNQTLAYTETTSTTAGKHRINLRAKTDGGDFRIYGNNGGSTPPSMVIMATRGKFDLAEEYSVLDPTIGAGDVVSLASSGGTDIERTNSGYQQNILGVVSTDPGITLSSTVELNSYQQRPNLRPVALKGRVPVKVTNENGPIRRGDMLTSSEKYPGYAMKATHAGPVIGIAMDNLTCSSDVSYTSILYSGENKSICTGKVMTFVNLSWYDPDVYLTSTGDFVINKAANNIAAATPDPQTGLYASPSPASDAASPSASPTSAPQVANCQTTTNSSNFGLVSSNCPQTVSVNYSYQIADSLGNVVQRVGAFSEAVIGNLRAGAVNAKEVIADTINVNQTIISPIAQIAQVKTDVITPLSSNKVVVKLEPASTSASLSASHSATPSFEIQNASGSAVATFDDKGNATLSGQLSAKTASISGELNADSATISGTLRTKNLVADNIDAAILNLKSSISNLLPKEASSSSLLSDLPPTASVSAGFANVDTLQAQVGTFMSGLFAVGPTSLSDASVFGQLSVGGNLILADNSINVLGSDLKLQSLGQGGILLGKKIEIDASGNLTVNGNATFNGTLFADTISPIPGNDLVLKLLSKNASDSAQFRILNASGSAVASINNNGEATFRKLNLNFISPAFALSDDELIATGSAGIATISARLKDVTILNKLVTDKSLIYITPVGSASAQTPYLLRQTSEDKSLNSEGSFTVGVQNENAEPLQFNWLIIN